MIPRKSRFSSRFDIELDYKIKRKYGAQESTGQALKKRDLHEDSSPRDLFKTQPDISKSFLWHKLPIVPGRGLYVNKKKKRCLKAFVKEACERAFTFFFKLPFRFPEIQTLS